MSILGFHVVLLLGSRSVTERDAKPQDEDKLPAPSPGAFPPTSWTRIVNLRSEDPAKAAQALSDLCETYWLPIYSYFRRAGRTADDSKDLTQGLFENMIRRGDFLKANEEKGKLRSFLLTIAKRHQIGEWRSQNSSQRGGGAPVLSLDADEAETRHASQVFDDLTPEKLFDRQWAAVTLESVREALKGEYVKRGRDAQFAVMQRYLAWNESDESPYAIAAEEAGLSLDAFRAGVVRMRLRFRKLLRDQVEDTIMEGEDVDAEIRHLFLALD